MNSSHTAPKKKNAVKKKRTPVDLPESRLQIGRWQNVGRLWMMTRTGQLWGTAPRDSITGVPGQCKVGRPGKWKLLHVVCSVAASGPHCWWPWELSLQRVPKEMHWLGHTPGLPRGALKWWTGYYFLNHSRILPLVIKNLEGVRAKSEWKDNTNTQHISNRNKYLCVPKSPVQEYPQLHSYTLRVGIKHDFQSQTAWFLFHISPALCDHWSVTHPAGSQVLVSQMGLVTVIVWIHFYDNLQKAPRRVPGAGKNYTGVSSYDDGVVEKT